MTKEEIYKYASKTTYSHNSTTVFLTNGEKRVGFFEDNILNSILYQNNQWNFRFFQALTSKASEQKIIINGNDIISIVIS